MGRGIDVYFGGKLFGLGVIKLEIEGVESAAVEEDTEGLDRFGFFHFNFYMLVLVFT